MRYLTTFEIIMIFRGNFVQKEHHLTDYYNYNPIVLLPHPPYSVLYLMNRNAA